MTPGRRLERILAGYGPTIVAFSGGVDSAVVATAARRALGDQVAAVLSDSPTLPRTEAAAARRLAAEIGVPFFALRRSELDDSGFVANPATRCGFCKKGLVEDLAGLARAWDVKSLVLGVNQSDLGDWRPGIEAARTAGARFPLVEAGLDKDAVRGLARSWGLSVWDKPAQPCLSSRIPYGTPVTLENLARVEAAEAVLHDRGFPEVRVRHLGDVARIEAPAAAHDRLAQQLPAVSAAIRALGYKRVQLDPRPLRSGRLNLEAGIRSSA